MRSGERVTTLRPASEFSSVKDIEQLPVMLPGGASVPLAKVASVRRVQAAPIGERVRFQGEPAVTLGVVPRGSD